MRISHALLFGVAAATLGFVVTSTGTAAPQDEQSATAMPPEMPDPVDTTPDQQAEIDGWPAEKQTAYAAWPDETKGYYWTLSPKRQAIFWALTDSDKVALTAMTGPEREDAWERIEAMAGDAPTAAESSG